MKYKNFCYFGSYDPKYSRNRIIKYGLESNGIKVFSCHSSGIIIKRYISLTYQFLKQRNKFSKLIVGFPGHYDVFLAYLLGRVFKKEVYYDIFTSTYETYVLDRKVIEPNSLRSKFFYYLDKLGLFFSDYIICDTKSHAKFFKELFKIKKDKYIIVYLGFDPRYFKQKSDIDNDVLFYGSYQPLQGVTTIVEVASKLPNYQFKLIGKGQTRLSAENIAKKLKVKNVKFEKWLSFSNLAKEIMAANITLGIFGSTKKANIVIPNKVFDYAAAGKLIITADTMAVKEIFKDGKNIVLVHPADPYSLKEAVDYFIKNVKKRNEIASNAKELIRKEFTPKKLVKNLI